MTQSIIKLSDRALMAQDPFYSTCALYGQHGHECEGKITWEHALIFAGKKCQIPNSIIPLCERAHAVNKYQDAGTLNKELNVWVALNRMTDPERRSISKAVDYNQRLTYLNGKYGPYSRVVPIQSTPILSTAPQENKKVSWHALSDKQKETIVKARKMLYKAENRYYTNSQIIDKIFESYDKEIDIINQTVKEQYQF